MLPTFNDSKVSLAKLAEAHPPLTPDSINPSCHLIWRNQP